METNEQKTPEELREEQAKLNKAKQEAHLPIFAPRQWFEAYGRKDVIEDEGKLEPFSADRKFAAQRLGIHNGSSLESVSLIVFLCMMTTDAVEMTRSYGYEGKTRAAFLKWCDAIGVGFGENPAVARLREITDSIWMMEAAAASKPNLPPNREPVPGNE